MTHSIRLALVAALALTAACGDDGIDSDETARRAYLGIDGSIEKCLNLGFAGFNAASSANIDPQMGAGDAAGTLVISGQVDQGASDNKGMRLYVAMVDYTDGIFTVEYENEDGDVEEVEVNLTYDTSEVVTDQPYLNLQLRNIPGGTFDGTLVGDYSLTGDIEAVVTLDLTMSGDMMEGATAGQIVRVPGSTTVTGTATSGDGLYQVNVTL